MSGLDRRSALKGAGATAAALAAAPLLGGTPKTPSPHSLAQAKGLRFGSATAALDPLGGSVSNPRYAALLEAEVGLLVPENEMKWQALRPGPGAFAFEPFDRIAAYAKARGMALRGHTLLWHRDQWMPAWMKDYDFGVRPAASAERMLRAHIEAVTARYGSQIHSFDVVNETVMPEDGSLAQTVLSRAMGGTEPLVDLAFHVARERLPGAQLVYNDYMGWEPGNEAHRAGVLRLLEGFRKRGVPVDALGLQSHLIVEGKARPQERAWRGFIDAVTAMGYALLITEFDVRGNGLSAAVAKRDAEVAAIGKAYLDLMLSYPQLRDVLVWGLCNRYSWLRSFEPRKDGKETRGCLYDDAFRPVPLRAAIAAAFAAAPKRTG